MGEQSQTQSGAAAVIVSEIRCKSSPKILAPKSVLTCTGTLVVTEDEGGDGDEANAQANIG